MSSASSQPDLVTRFAALSDPVRLRMLRLLGTSELSVGELARTLQLPQSTVSRHLKTLHEGAWIVRRSEGTASLYQLVGSALDETAAALWRITQDQLIITPTHEEDDARLRDVLAERRMDSKSYFGRLGGEWDSVRRDLFGSEFTPSALVSLVSRDWTVADLGCGTGNATEYLAPFVRKVIAIDREPAMLDAAKARLTDLKNVEFRQGELTNLPLKPGEVDAAMVYLVLHHLEEPGEAVTAAAAALRPGGVLMIVDMVRHDRTEYRHTMGHKHLGFTEKQVRSWANAANLADTQYRRLRPAASGKGPGLFVATLTRHAGSRAGRITGMQDSE